MIKTMSKLKFSETDLKKLKEENYEYKICSIGLTFLTMMLCILLVIVDKERLYYKYGDGCKEILK